MKTITPEALLKMLYQNYTYYMYKDYGQGGEHDGPPVYLNGFDLSSMDIRKLCERYKYETAYGVTYRVSLAGASIVNSNLSGVDLSNMHMEGVIMENIDLSNACLANADLRASQLINVNLTGADLSGVNLSYATLTNVNLLEAYTANANIMRVIISEEQQEVKPRGSDIQD